MKPGRVFVVGVGYTGRRLLDRLDDAVGLGRTAGPGIRLLDLDEDDGPSVDTRENDAVVYTVPPNGAYEEDLRLGRLLARLSAPPRRFVYLSTTGVYGDHGGGTVDETTPVAPATDRARRRVAAERMLDRWCGERGTELVVLRVPGIYGPGRLGLERLDSGRAMMADGEAGPGNRIHVDDLVGCCIAALRADVPAGAYNVGDGDHRSSTAFAAEVARQAGLPAPATASRAEVLAKASPMLRSFLEESRRVDVSRMRDVLKPGLRYADPVEGIAASLEAGDAA